MKFKYRKFNQYIERRYIGFETGYRVIRSCKGYRLRYSQINEKHSEKMKNIKKYKKWDKHLYDIRHRIRQKEQRILRESRKQFIEVLDEIEV